MTPLLCVLVSAPGRGCRSTTHTLSPCAAMARAEASPVTPAPITRTSTETSGAAIAPEYRPRLPRRRAIVEWSVPASSPDPMDRTFALVGALAGLIGVSLGAFGAHGLRTRVSAEMLNVFETGVRYQMYHALAILAVAALMPRLGAGRLIVAAGWLFVGGIVLFS